MFGFRMGFTIVVDGGMIVGGNEGLDPFNKDASLLGTDEG